MINDENKDPKDVKPPERYCNMSMKSLRAGINRYMKEKRGLDIIADQQFQRANKIFDAVLKDNKSKGKGVVHHKKPITSQDLECLNDYFSRYMTPNAAILQRLVQFNLMFYLCRRGRENLTHIPRNTFAVSINFSSLVHKLIIYRLSQKLQ